MFPVDSHDRMIGVLPFFHSFGFTGTLWFPMVAGFGALYIPNPMDAKAVGQLGEVRRHDADRAVDQCGIKTILTSKVFLAKANLPQLPGMVYLEDVMRTFSAPQKALTLMAARLLPSGVLRRLYARERGSSDDLATVIFSERQHGQAEGRDAVTSQRALEPGGHDPDVPGRQPRPHDRGRAAVLPTRSASPARSGSRWSRASAGSTSPTRWTRRP